MLIAHEAFPYPAALRRAVLAAMNAERTSTAELARLNWRLGMEYARAVRATAEKHRAKVELIGCHGQTLYHQGKAAAYAGQTFACTWQAGEPALLAAEMGVPVVENFRPADMAAGGQGAPLVPLLDYVLFADAERGRVLQNIGGIANLTAIPAGAGPEAVVAFDTGPGNMVIDWLAGDLLGKKFDRDGRAAARGKIIEEVLERAVREPFYAQAPPKSAGREQFGAEYAARFLKECRRFSERAEDALATATALTAATIGQSYVLFVISLLKGNAVDFIVSGGGARNGSLMKMLRIWLEKCGCAVKTSADFGLPEEAKEAAAFALLAWMTWNRRPGNVPSATGAKHAVVLGSVTHV
jgi:anhydro-N-acetylmuramic acid kinase